MSHFGRWGCRVVGILLLLSAIEAAPSTWQLVVPMVANSMNTTVVVMVAMVIVLFGLTLSGIGMILVKSWALWVLAGVFIVNLLTGYGFLPFAAITLQWLMMPEHPTLIFWSIMTLNTWVVSAAVVFLRTRRGES